MSRCWGLLFLCATVSGCAGRLHVESDPVGAVVSLDGMTLGVTPLDLKVPYRPFFLSPRQLRMSMPRHRPMTVHLGREARLDSRLRQLLFHPAVAFGIRDSPTLEVLLIESHGPVGTWEAD